MKLHLGCGKRYLEGFVHIDIADFEHIDFKSSIDNLEMIKDNSCDLIYASHVLEYFNLDEADAVLNEWRKKIKKNGVLRVAVPNLESLILIYNKINGHSFQLFKKNQTITYISSDAKG